MIFLAFICFMAIVVCIMILKDKACTTVKGKAITVLVLIAAVTATLSLVVSQISNSSSSGKKWSDLSDVEKDNARWAYHAQQAIDNYDK